MNWRLDDKLLFEESLTIFHQSALRNNTFLVHINNVEDQTYQYYQIITKLLLEHCNLDNACGLIRYEYDYTGCLNMYPVSDLFSDYLPKLVKEFNKITKEFETDLHRIKYLEFCCLGHLKDIWTIIDGYLNQKATWASNISKIITSCIENDTYSKYLSITCIPSANIIVQLVTQTPLCGNTQPCGDCFSKLWCDKCQKHICNLHECGIDKCNVIHGYYLIDKCNFCTKPIEHKGLIDNNGVILWSDQQNGIPIRPKKLWSQLCNAVGGSKLAIACGYNKNGVFHCKNEMKDAIFLIEKIKYNAQHYLKLRIH